MQATAEAIAAPINEATIALGTAYAGGFYMGRVFVGLTGYALIVAPRAEGEHDEIKWNDADDNVAGALSYFDGAANTATMAAAGSELARWAQGLTIGGHDDWFIPSRQDLLVIKGNEAEAGAPFAEGGDEAFARDWYWSSTQDASNPDCAWFQGFGSGTQTFNWKDNDIRARAVRRVPL